jgi:hypothetical protein
MKHPASLIWSEYLDGGLAEAEARELEDHLSVCRACSDLLRELEEVQARAHALSDLVPERDLWPEIAQALAEVDGRDPAVIQLHPEVPGPAPKGARRFVRLSPLQAAAAGLALALISGSAGALMARSASSDVTPVVADEAHWLTTFAGSNHELQGVAAEVARLEEILARHREVIGSSTVEVLERNLQVMDRAIRESHEALQTDPGNAFLEAHLTRAFRAKAEYLRETTALMVAAT